MQVLIIGRLRDPALARPVLVEELWPLDDGGEEGGEAASLPGEPQVPG